jgi:ABC-type glutathione transport system ATPase component
LVPVGSIGEAVSQLQEYFFVGRQSELDNFRTWLSVKTRIPEVLALSGPSGVGKSALLRAFKRIAEESGRPVVLVNGGSFPATPRGLLGAISNGATDDLCDVVAQLNEANSVILIDSFE